MFKLIREWVDRYFSDPQVLVLGLILGLGFLIVYLLGSMLAPVLVGLIIAYLLEGMVSRLERFRIPRLIAVIAVFSLFIASLLFLIVGLLPMLSRQIIQLFQDLPAMITTLEKQIMALPAKYPDLVSEQQILQIFNYISLNLTRMGQYILSVSISSVRGIITFIVYLILVPLMVFFFLKDKNKIMDWVKGFLPRERKLSQDVWLEVNQQLENYIRGKAWEIIIVWLASYITFTWLGLKFAMLISLFVGLSVLIPYIGATVMYLPITLIAYFQFGWSAPFAYVLIAYSVLQILDGNLLVPLLLSGVVNLHPVAIIVAVLIFGGLWGLVGLFFAIPLATLVQATLNAWLPRRHPETGPREENVCQDED